MQKVDIQKMSAILKWVRDQQNVLQHVGGYQNAFRRLLRECNVRTGQLIGEDKYGNKYYENKTYFMGRSRFVEYPYKGRLDFDGSQIPAEWHRWMHYMTDDPPSTHPPTPRKFFIDHAKNPSGSKDAYIPYSTTTPKIEFWKPGN